MDSDRDQLGSADERSTNQKNNILDADDLDYNSMLAMPSADVLAQLIALSQMNAAASGNKKKKKNKRPVVTATKAPVAAAAPAASSSKGNKKKKQKQKKTTPAPTTQAPTTVQVTTQAPETEPPAASVFEEEEGSGGFGGNSFEGMDMSQFDTYDYGYEDDERSEEVEDSFHNETFS